MNYNIKETIGKGGYGTVKRAQHKETGTMCALKIIAKNPKDLNQEGLFESEVQVMKELSHPNIIQLLDYNYNDTYTNPYGRSFEVYSMGLELANQGELFDFIAETGSFDEEVSRHFFHQMMDGLEYMWSKGIKHRDIKPENLLLDNNFVLKYADFGFASDEEYSNQKRGTTSYMAPEVFLKDEFMTKPLDIFAAGIVLFTMYAAIPPFADAKSNNPHYNMFLVNNDKFWMYHEKRMNGRKFSKNFKTLINSMLDYDPENRPDIDQIKQFDWYNGSLPTEDMIIDEFSERSEMLHEAKE